MNDACAQFVISLTGFELKNQVTTIMLMLMNPRLDLHMHSILRCEVHPAGPAAAFTQVCDRVECGSRTKNSISRHAHPMDGMG